MAEYAEQEVIKGCLRKDRLYEEYLYKKYYSIFLTVCVRYAKDIQNAKQLLNDGFVRIFMSISSFRNEGSFEGWMRKIMVNTCLEYLKSSEFKKSNQTIHKEVIEDNTNHAVYNDAISNINTNDLIALLQSLPPVTRTVFNLFVFEDYTHNEIAALLNMSTGTSHWHVHHARKTLQQLIVTKNKLYEQQ